MSPQSEPTVWQVSAGPSDRNFADVFLNQGVALIGPGDSGPWNQGRVDEDFGGGYVRRFASEVKIGDLLLLRTGIAKVRAVGIVASDYLHLEQFDDVNGWDLQHARRVRWLQFSAEQEWTESVFGANPPRFSRTQNQEVIDFAMRFLHSEPSLWRGAPLPELAAPTTPLVAIPPEIADVVTEVLDHAPQYRDADRFGERPTEGELLAHLVVPFFKALGWPTSLIGVQWQYIDVALFEALPRRPENLRFVVEVKRIDEGIEGALGQARKYLKALAIQRDIIVTDGIRYRLYSHEKEFAPTHYANLAWLKEPALGFLAAVRRGPR